MQETTLCKDDRIVITEMLEDAWKLVDEVSDIFAECDENFYKSKPWKLMCDISDMLVACKYFFED